MLIKNIKPILRLSFRKKFEKTISDIRKNPFRLKGRGLGGLNCILQMSYFDKHGSGGRKIRYVGQ
jgi:hypothetical protein